MSFEVEQKYRTSSHETIAQRLAELGATPATTLDQLDAYFNHPARDFAATGEAFRLRRVGNWSAVTYKGPKLAGPTKTREEIEIPFAGGAPLLEQAHRLLTVLGFRPVAEIHKHRTPYHLTFQGRDMEVVLDQVTELGPFVEVETIVADDADLPAAQSAVLALAHQLGLTEREPRSYLRMVLEQRAEAADV